MFDVVNLETGEIYGTYNTADEAFDWMEENCEVSEFYNFYGYDECVYYYNGDLVDVLMI